MKRFLALILVIMSLTIVVKASNDKKSADMLNLLLSTVEESWLIDLEKSSAYLANDLMVVEIECTLPFEELEIRPNVVYEYISTMWVALNGIHEMFSKLQLYVFLVNEGGVMYLTDGKEILDANGVIHPFVWGAGL